MEAYDELYKTPEKHNKNSWEKTYNTKSPEKEFDEVIEKLDKTQNNSLLLTFINNNYIHYR
jgi:hypothetical protein